MGSVVPFPKHVNRPFVARHARRAAAMKREESAETYLENQIEAWRWRLEKFGVAPDIVDSEMTALWAAVRAEMWRQVLLRPEGAA